MELKREPATIELVEELKPLMLLHYQEISHFQDIPLDIDIEKYLALEAAGALRVFTARDFEGAIVGYSCFILFTSPHYRTSLQAVQDALFIRPDRRGFGKRFVKFCDEMLRADGCQVSIIHVNAKHNFGKMLEAVDYELLEHIFIKRLDRPAMTSAGSGALDLSGASHG